MAYNPGVNDVSGQIYGQGIAAFGQGIGRGLEIRGQKKEEERNILAEANGRGKAIYSAFKGLEDMGVVPAGFSDRVKEMRESLSPRDQIPAFDTLSKELGTIMQGGVHMQQIKARESAENAERERMARMQQAMQGIPNLDPVIAAGMGSGMDAGQVAALSNANTNAIESQRPKERAVPAAMQEIEARIQADLAAGAYGQDQVNVKRSQYYAEAAKKAPATSINLGNNMKQEAFKSLLSEKQTNMIPLVGAKPTLDAMDAMLDAVNDDGKVITGALAKVELGTKRLLNATGLTNFEDVASTQAYLGATVRLTGQIIKDFGAGTALSDADREYAMRAAAGDITMDKAALKRLAANAKKVMKARLDNYNRSVTDAFDPEDEDGKYALRALKMSLPEAVAPAPSIFDEADAIIGRK